MSRLWQARFYTTVNRLVDLPAIEVPEIAFAGRSNAGKSTAINVLCNQKNLAHASRTPGRTQHINFFSVGGAHVAQHRKDPTKTDEIEAFLVDLPGYGFAQVPHSAKEHWQTLLADYLMTRPQLAGLVLVMDARRPFQPLDTQLLEWFSQTGRPIHCILTKADKLNKSESSRSLRQTQTILGSYADERGQPLPFSVQLFSATKRVGLDEATKWIKEITGLEQKSIRNPDTDS